MTNYLSDWGKLFFIPFSNPLISRVRNYEINSNNKIAKIGDEEVELLAAPKAVDGRTLVPLRFISEAFGVSPEWDGANQTITAAKDDVVIWLQLNEDIS